MKTILCIVLLSTEAVFGQRFLVKLTTGDPCSPNGWPAESTAVTFTNVPTGWSTNWTLTQINARIAALQSAKNASNLLCSSAANAITVSNEVDTAVLFAKSIATSTNDMGRFLAAQATVNWQIYQLLRTGAFTNQTRAQYLSAITNQIQLSR